MAEFIFYIIIAILVFDYILERLLDYLNSRLWSNDLPAELQGIYDAGKYRKSQDYTRTNTRFSIYSDTVSFVAMMLMLLLGGFAFLDSSVWSVTTNPILMSLMFFGILASNENVTRIRMYQVQNNLYRRGLSCPRLPHETDHLAFGYIELETLQDRLILEVPKVNLVK